MFNYLPVVLPPAIPSSSSGPTKNQPHPYNFSSYESVLQNYNSSQFLTDPATHTLEPITTGTSVLGVKGTDFVMLASDTNVSYGSLSRFRSIQRIRNVGSSTLIGATGEYSDFQFVMQLLDELIVQDKLHDDGSILTPKEIHSYLTRVMYNRRNNFNPFYNQFVLAGFNPKDQKSFLGMVDLVGTSYEDDTIATGIAGYIARPLLRRAWRPELNREEAKKLLEDCMRVLFYRDARSINKIQIGIVSAEGWTVSTPYSLNTHWEHSEKALADDRLGTW